MIKPILELLAAVPTVVYGYFALLFCIAIVTKMFLTCLAQMFYRRGLVIGIMIVPYVSSLAEDAMETVPSITRRLLCLGRL